MQYRLCECGCRRSLAGRRAGTRFFNGACRLRALRAREKRNEKWASLGKEFNDGWNGLDARYGGAAKGIKQKIAALVDVLEPEQCDQLMRVVWCASRLEWEFKS